VQRGLEVYLAETGLWDPRGRGPGPGVHEVHMLWDMLVMGLPEHIRFKGTTTEGEYTGTYNTKTLEVNTDVEIGGVVVPGVGEAAKHGDTIIKISGTMKEGDLQVRVNGKKAEMPKPATNRARPDKADALPVAPGL